MKKRIALVTAGGHVASFHAAMQEMYAALAKKGSGDFELVGARGGLSGLVAGDFVPLKYNHLDIDKAGSLFGADRKVADAAAIKASVDEHDIYAVIMMGGDNHLGEAKKCFDMGVPIVGWPKTMDGDLNSHITLGYDTAVRVGSLGVRHHHATAMTYGKVFYVGLFGRNTDWVLAAVTAYGTKDIGIPCEQEYDLDFLLGKVEESYRANERNGFPGFAVVPFSEGARIKGVNPLPDEHYSVDAHGLPKLRAAWIGMELERLTKKHLGIGASSTEYTYAMRDSPPTPIDKLLAASAGEECINMVLEGDFGKAVVFEPHRTFFTPSRADLGVVAQQRFLKPTGFFDYDALRTNLSFIEVYGNLFANSLDTIPSRDSLIYGNRL